MLHLSGRYMAKGQSGRVVIELDPLLKRQLYSALASDGSTLKAWFIMAAEKYLSDRQQPSLPLVTQKTKLGSDQ